MINNKIGCSVPFDYLAGSAGTEFEAVFGKPDNCMKLFRSYGIESVEIRSVSVTTPPDILLRCVEKLRSFEMNVSIHASLPDIYSHEQTIPSILALPADMEFIITVHAYAGGRYTVEQYTNKTISVMRQLLNNAPANIIFAIELNRRKNCIVDGSATYSGILTMLNRLQSLKVGVCWDFGHAEANVINGFLARTPPMNFLQRVVHTHIHDISNNGITHFPLTCANIPLQEYLKQLKNVKYSGILNFEPSIDRWCGNIRTKRKLMLTSFKKLKTEVNRNFTIAR